MNKQTVLKEVAYFLQQEDTNGSYVEYLEEDSQQENIDKILSYYKDILNNWIEEEQDNVYYVKNISLYMKYIKLIDSVL